MEEIAGLKNILMSKRSHFKEIEKADFANLEQQLKGYNDQLKQLGIDSEAAKFYSAKRAIIAAEKNPNEQTRQ